MSKKLLIFLLITNILLFAGCSNNIAVKEKTLESIDGAGITYSEYFKAYDELDKRKNPKFYKPIQIDKLDKLIENDIKKAVGKLDVNTLPFQADEQYAYLVTSEKDGVTIDQLQLSYIEKSEDGFDDEQFFIISITEAENNPLPDHINVTKDHAGNELRNKVLSNGDPIYQQIITTDSALDYSYYQYNEENDEIQIVTTHANEIYAYYDGYIYHFGYYINDINDEEILQMAIDFIES